MNFIRALPSAADLWDRYTHLAPGPKLVLRLKSLVWLPTGKTEFLTCLTRSGLQSPHGGAWTGRAVNAALEQLLQQGLLTEQLACPPALLHPVAIDASASAEAEVLIASIRRVFPAQLQRLYYGYTSPSDHQLLQRAVRLAVYANDAAGFTTLRDHCKRARVPGGTAQALITAFAEVPLAIDWLATRQPIIQAALIEARFVAVLATGEHGSDLPALMAWLRPRQGQEGFDDTAEMLLHYDVVAGRLDDVRSAIATRKENAKGTPQTLEGTLAFLEGRNAEALQHYRNALKQQRKHLGRRKVFIGDENGVFFLMALLQANDPALHAEITAGLQIALEDEDGASGAFHAMLALLWVVQGLDQRARQLLRTLRAQVSGPFSAACIALAEYAVDADLAREQEAELAARFEHLRDALPLIARIYAEILAEVAAAPTPYRAWLAETAGTIGLAFTRIIQLRQPWERVLENLDAFLGGEASKSDAAKAPRKAKRLAWFIDPETLDIAVVEQAAKGLDGWTDGRPVAMKRLHEQDPRLDYLTDQDRRALRCIRKTTATGWYGEDSFEFDTPRTIASLTGHPSVFDLRQRSQPIELVSYPLELVVTETAKGYAIALSHSASQATVFLEAETPARYRVIEFPKLLFAVQEILGSEGLTVPKAARDQVIALVRRDNPTLPIRADIAEVERPGVAGRAEPAVQLVPYGDGLKIALLVRPFGAEGPAYVAGLGGRSVLASIAGQQTRANRDLPRELAERNALIEACPTLRDRGGPDTQELVIEDLEGCLELLLELQACSGPVSIEWPEGHKLRVSPVTPARLKLRVGQDRDWFSVDGTVALDDDQVLEMRFLLERLGQARGRFVPLGDGSFVALTRQLQDRLQHLTAVSEPHKNGRRVHALGAPVLDAVLDAVQEGAGDIKADAAWKRHIARIRSTEGWTPVLPPTLQAELRDYQVEGFVWLARLARWGAGACLADDMGLGKTVQAIAVMLDRAEEGPCLVVAPTSVCPNWEAEIARFAPTLTAHRLSGAADRGALIAGLGPRDVLVCSYGLLHQAAELLAGRPWQMVVLDEAQAIKNAETRRAQASVTLQAGFRLALTGTPVENYLDELWSLFHFVNPGLLGSREGFQKRFAVPIERDRDAHARQALRALIRPFLLRRTKAAVLSELPPRTEQTVAIEMAEPERAFYEALRQRALESLAAMDAPNSAPMGGRRKIQILAEITRLRRACCNPALIDAAAGVPSGKLDAFLELVEELVRNRHRALVFSQFVGHLELVRTALDARGIRYEYLDGSTPSAERERRVAAFQSGSAELFLISLRAGGTGLNLTAADYVVHLDPWWNPAVEDQASDRAHRIGQERPVTIYRLIMQDSIEERILRLHRDKRDLASELLDGSEVAGRLSEEELLDLIRA